MALILFAFVGAFVFLYTRGDATPNWATSAMQTMWQVVDSSQRAFIPKPPDQAVDVEASLYGGSRHNKYDIPSDLATAGSSKLTTTDRKTTDVQLSPITVEPTSSAPFGESKDGLKEVECAPNCSWDYEPAVSDVEWLQHPTVSADGELFLKARVGKNNGLILPNSPGGGASNIALTDGRTKLYGSVIPPAPTGMTWNPVPGQWVSGVYTYYDNVLTVRAPINPRATDQPGLTLCLWTGGHGNTNRVLDCVAVSRP